MKAGLVAQGSSAPVGAPFVMATSTERFSLTEAREAHELLGKGGVTGKLVLVPTGSSRETGAA